MNRESIERFTDSPTTASTFPDASWKLLHDAWNTDGEPVVRPGIDPILFSFEMESNSAFYHFDNNSDGSIDRAELELVLADETPEGTDREFAQLMLDNYDELCKLNNDGKQGITHEDANQYRKKAKQPIQDGRHAMGFYSDEQEFQYVDKNSDGYLSMDELKLIRSLKIHYPERSDALNYLIDNYVEIRRANNAIDSSNKGISMEDITDYSRALNSSPLAGMVDNIEKGMYEISMKRFHDLQRI